MNSLLTFFLMGSMWLSLFISAPSLAKDSPAETLELKKAESAQDIPEELPRFGLVFGASTWFNNCDVPAGGHDTSLQPSFGPNFQLSYGKLFVGGTFFWGKFDVEPEPAIHSVDGQFEFIDEEAHKRGFTSNGDTKRIDFTLNAGYKFSRAAVLSFSFVVNRHEVDLNTHWFPQEADGNLQLPTDSTRTVPFDYTATQYWFGQHFGGSIPIETVSTRFSFFYGAGLLVILGETGSTIVNGVSFDSPRVSYTKEEGGIAGPSEVRRLPPRPFGENVGVTLNLGIGFQLFNRPNVGVYGGYNLKFFAEDETEFVDHSRFHGPFFGLSWTVK